MTVMSQLTDKNLINNTEVSNALLGQLSQAASTQNGLDTDQLSFIIAQVNFTHASEPEAEQVLPLLDFCTKHYEHLSLSKKTNNQRLSQYFTELRQAVIQLFEGVVFNPEKTSKANDSVVEGILVLYS